MPVRRSGSGSRRPADRRLPVEAATPIVEEVVEVPEAVQAPEPVQPEAPARPTSTWPVGATMYPLDTEKQEPEEWYERDVTSDLASLGKARAGLTRVFVSWRVIEPQVGQYSREALDRLASIVSAAHAKGIKTIVCLFGDDRHSELNDVVWASRRDPRTDSYLLQRTVEFVEAVATHLKSQAGVYGWQIGTEAFFTRFESDESMAAWFELVSGALREIDPDRPMGIGADAETLFAATGRDIRPLVDQCDFAVSHVTSAYRAYAAGGPITSGPSTYLDAFLARLAMRGAPVIMDDLGAIELDYSASEEAAYLRTSLWSGMMNRASAAMARRVRDMDTEKREPYFLDPFETLIGLADTEGTPKPSFAELAAFTRSLGTLDPDAYQLVADRVAIMVPDERYAPLPSLAGLYGPRATIQSFIAAKEAHASVTLVREGDDLSDYLVLVVPSAFTLTEDTWTRIAGFAQSGGTVLLSYGGGDGVPAIRDVFGMEFLGDAGPRSRLSCRIAQPDVLGAIRSFDAYLEVPNFAQLAPVTATVVATDENGSPLLAVNQVGQGRAVLVAAPLERAIAQDDPWSTPAAVRTLVRELYGAVVRGAGAGMPLECDDPHTEVALFQGPDDDVVALLNHSRDKRTVTLGFDRQIATVADLKGGEPVAIGSSSVSVPLASNGAMALRITYART